MSDMVRFAFDQSVLDQFRMVALQDNTSIAGSLANMTWAWPRVTEGRSVPGILAENFEQVWSDGQGAWAQPTAAYTERKLKQGYGAMTMVRTKRLYNALTTAGGEFGLAGGTSDTISFGDARNYYYGVNTENFRGAGGWSYPEIHQYQGDARGVTRPFIRVVGPTAQNLNTWLGLTLRSRLSEIHGRLQSRVRKSRVKL